MDVYEEQSRHLSPSLGLPYRSEDPVSYPPAHPALSQGDLGLYAYSPSPPYHPHSISTTEGPGGYSSPLPISIPQSRADSSEAEFRISPSASTPPIPIPLSSSAVAWNILADTGASYDDVPHQAYTPSYGSFQSSYTGSPSFSSYGSPLPPRISSPSFEQDLPPPQSTAGSNPLFAAYDWRESSRHFNDSALDDAYSSVGNADDRSSVSGYGSIYNTPAMADDIEMATDAERSLPSEMQGMAMFEPIENVSNRALLGTPEREDTLRPATTPNGSTEESSTKAADKSHDEPYRAGGPVILTGGALSCSPPQESSAPPALNEPMSPPERGGKDPSPPLSKLQIPNMPHVAIQSATPTAIPHTARQNTAGTMEVERIFDSLVRSQEATAQVGLFSMVTTPPESYHRDVQNVSTSGSLAAPGVATARPRSAEPAAAFPIQPSQPGGPYLARPPQRQRSQSDAGIMSVTQVASSTALPPTFQAIAPSFGGAGHARPGWRSSQTAMSIDPRMLDGHGDSGSVKVEQGAELESKESQAGPSRSHRSSISSSGTRPYDDGLLRPEPLKRSRSANQGHIRQARSEDLSAMHSYSPMPHPPAPLPTMFYPQSRQEFAPLAYQFAPPYGSHPYPNWPAMVHQQMAVGGEGLGGGGPSTSSRGSPARSNSGSSTGRAEPVHWTSQTTAATKQAADARRKAGSDAKFVCEYCGESYSVSVSSKARRELRHWSGSNRFDVHEGL
jgi:hypothetical protein